MHVFAEPKRQNLRKKKNRSLIIDFFLSSPPESYRLIRILISLPFGFGLAYVFWYFLLSARDLGSENLGVVFKWFFVGIVTLVFSIEPTVRSTMLLSTALVLTSQGQTLVSAFITDRLMEGPIENIMKNFEKASLSLVCNLNLAAQVAHARLQLMYQPIRDLAIDLSAGSAETERAIRNLDKLFGPVKEETEGEKETRMLEKSNENMNRIMKIAQKQEKKQDKYMQKRTRKPWKSKTPEPMDMSSYVSQFNSPIAKKYSEKLSLRCEDIYNQAYELCDEEMPDVETYCNTFLSKKGWFLPVRVFVCWLLRGISMCDMAKAANIRDSECKDKNTGVSKIVTPDFDDLLRQIGEDGRSLGAQMKVNVYFKLVEQPRLLRFRAVEDIQIKLKGSVDWLRDAAAVIRLLIAILFVFLVFNGIRNSFLFTEKYLTDIRFQNVFLTSYFWKIDKRQPEGSRLQKLHKFEFKDNKLMSPWKPVPTSEDLQKMILAFMKFLFFVVLVTAVLVMDYSLYRMLFLVDSLSGTSIEQKGFSRIYSEVSGEGFMAKMVKSMILTFNHSKTIHQDLNNDACDIRPTELPDSFYWELGLILGILMLLVQVCLTFVIHRVKLFWIAGWLFPRRHKARIIFLYNRLLRERILFLKLRKGRIRQMVLERSLEAERGFGILKFLHQVPVVNIFFGRECMICGDAVKPKTMKTCPNLRCAVSYCPECWEVLEQRCYVCQVESGDATIVTLGPQKPQDKSENDVERGEGTRDMTGDTEGQDGAHPSPYGFSVDQPQQQNFQPSPVPPRNTDEEIPPLPVLPYPPLETRDDRNEMEFLPVLPFPPSDSQNRQVVHKDNYRP